MTKQNTSHAVMSQRLEPKDSLDFFPTPPWATRALCEFLRPFSIDKQDVWEPCCGSGDMVRPLSEYFGSVKATDINPRGVGSVLDFFSSAPTVTDWIISNPPFNRAEEFVLKALKMTRVGVAVFTRLTFLESVGRYNRLFKDAGPSYVLPFSERVPIHKGKLTKDGSTATAYCWLVWIFDESHPYTIVEWIPPCRSTLEKEKDYHNHEDTKH